MTTDRPRVSVLIPAYNAESFITAAIASVLSQTMTDLELVVVDDGSRDGTAAAAETAIAGDPRARLLRQQNRGLSGARNAALSAARAPYVALLDNDDLWRPTKLELQLAAIEADPDLVCVGCFVGYIGESGRTAPRLLDGRVRGGEDPRSSGHQDLIRRGLLLPFPPCAMLIRRAALEQIGGSDERLAYSEDVDTLARLAGVGAIGFVPEVLADYRMRTGSWFGANFLEARREGMFVALRQRAKLAGSTLTWEEFTRDYVATRSMRRAARSGDFTRKAAAAVLDRRYPTAVVLAAVAIWSQPTYLLARIRRSVLSHGTDPDGYRTAMAPDGSAWLQ